MVEDLVLGVGIHAGKRVVENQNAGIADDGARNRGPLFLSAGKSDAALADQRPVLFGKFFNVRPRCWPPRPLRIYFFVGGIFLAEGDVFPDGLAEQKSFLRHKADLPAQSLQTEIRAPAGHRSVRSRVRRRKCAGSGLTSVVLPEPVGPTMARLLPAGMRRLMSCRTGAPL